MLPLSIQMFLVAVDKMRESGKSLTREPGAAGNGRNGGGYPPRLESGRRLENFCNLPKNNDALQIRRPAGRPAALPQNCLRVGE
jgi:hypothetical protein